MKRIKTVKHQFVRHGDKDFSRVSNVVMSNYSSSYDSNSDAKWYSDSSKLVCETMTNELETSFNKMVTNEISSMEILNPSGLSNIDVSIGLKAGKPAM